MSRLSIVTTSRAQTVVEGLYKDLERRIIASPPGLCPVDLTASFLKMCMAQTCGKCVPCRIGLSQLDLLLNDILEGRGTLDTLNLIEKTARVISSSADCAIGCEAANMVLKSISAALSWRLSTMRALCLRRPALLPPERGSPSSEAAPAACLQPTICS